MLSNDTTIAAAVSSVTIENSVLNVPSAAQPAAITVKQFLGELGEIDNLKLSVGKLYDMLRQADPSAPIRSVVCQNINR